LIVADVRGWIFERHALEIQKRLSHKYEIDICYSTEGQVSTLSSDKDLVYVMDPMPMLYPSPKKVAMGLRCQWLYERHSGGAKGLYEQGREGVVIKDRCSLFHVVNNNQYDEFKDIVTDRPFLKVQHGVDTNLFCGNINLSNSKLRVGFAGRASGYVDKGYNIIESICQDKSYDFKPADYSGSKKSKEEMPEFYRNIDVFVCFSESEGHNNALLEAGAMGVPVISTRTGTSGEIIRPMENGILIDKIPDALEKALEMMENSAMRKIWGKALQEEIINNWSWDKKIKEYEDMFDLFFTI